MKTIVIWVNWNDFDTLSLTNTWKNLPNTYITEINKSTDVEEAEESVNAAISNCKEDDTIIFAGHGTEHGLLYPDLNKGIYLLHSENVYNINAKRIIFDFCNAYDFASKFKLKGFFTSMFITNEKEAESCKLDGIDLEGYTIKDIEASAIKHANILNLLLKSNKPITNDWKELYNYWTTSKIDKFNYEGITVIE